MNSIIQAFDNGDLKPSLALANDLPVIAPPSVDRDAYRAECKQYWGGFALQDALSNWAWYENRKGEFIAWLQLYRRDCQLIVGPIIANPNGTLEGLIWTIGDKMPGLIDFEEHFQRCFPRRGSRVYLRMLLESIEGKSTNHV